MDYKIQSFQNGSVLNDNNLNYIENGILDLYDAIFISNHYLKKPYTFQGKSAKFFGDSITYGYTKDDSGSAIKAKNGGYPKVFSDKVGLSFQNLGVSGSLFGDYNNLNKIQDKIYDTSLDCDYIFIAGGINDWQCGTPINTFRERLTEVCEYLKNNFTGIDVFFITPINHSGRKPIVTPVAEVQTYRNIITELSLQYGYSVIQGNRINFPTINNVDSFKTLMFCDNLHPSELGYKIYGESLTGILC